MANKDIEPGGQLLFLLRQQRRLYHQLKILTDRQEQLSESDSPEMQLSVIFGRRKLSEKLGEVEDRLAVVKGNWRQLSGRLDADSRAQVRQLLREVQQLVGQIHGRSVRLGKVLVGSRMNRSSEQSLAKSGV